MLLAPHSLAWVLGQEARLNWAGAQGRDDARVFVMRAVVHTNAGLSLSQGAPGRMGAQGEPGLAGYNVRKAHPNPLRNSVLLGICLCPPAPPS